MDNFITALPFFLVFLPVSFFSFVCPLLVVLLMFKESSNEKRELKRRLALATQAGDFLAQLSVDLLAGRPRGDVCKIRSSKPSIPGSVLVPQGSTNLKIAIGINDGEPASMDWEVLWTSSP